MANWQKIYSREYSVQYCEIALRCGALESRAILGGHVARQAFVPEGRGVQSYFVDSDEWAQVNAAVEKFHAGDAKRFNQFKKSFDAIGTRYLDQSRLIAKLAQNGASRAQLLPAYAAFCDSWRDYCAILWAAWMLNERFSAKAEALLTKKVGVKKGKQLAASVMHPSRMTEIAEAHDELSRMKKNGFNDAEIKKFHSTYAWLACLDVFNAPWTLDEVRRAVQSAKSEKAEEKTIPMAKVLALMDLSNSEEFILNSAHDLVFIKDQRDVYRRKGVYLSRPFFQAVARMAGQDVSDVAYWTRDEMHGFLSGAKAVALSDVLARKEGFMLFEQDGQFRCLTGDAIAPELKKLGIVVGLEKSAVSVKGIVGSRGFGAGQVTGTACIVRTVADLDKVKTGDVMVAITTHPDFVPAMHRACAIVTDEGGITSHAAIVSREFGIPCVVGTKKATTAFADGDVLQVNAIKGVVKKVKEGENSLNGFDTARASEKSLAKAWLSKEEDDAWAHLQEKT